MTVGALPAVTVIWADALRPPLLAVTLKGPPAQLPAVNSPTWLTVPPLEADQVNSGGGDSVWPN